MVYCNTKKVIGSNYGLLKYKGGDWLINMVYYTTKIVIG